MRLASKIFLTSALVIVVLAGVAALSLRAMLYETRLLVNFPEEKHARSSRSRQAQMVRA